MSSLSTPAGRDRSHAERDLPDPGRDPDLRAVFRERRFLLIPWGDAVRRRWAGGRCRMRHDEIVFELWDQGERVLARQYGAGPAEPEIERLRRWADSRGARLRIGTPFGPARLGAGPAIDLPRLAASEPPAFRFVYPAPEFRRSLLWVAPWGFISDLTASLREPWRGAVGEVRWSGRDRAVARFARLDREHSDAVHSGLRRWAAADRLELEFGGPRPLGDPDPRPPTHAGLSRCGVCGKTTATGSVSHMGFGTRGWIGTRCGICGGRRRWHGDLDRGVVSDRYPSPTHLLDRFDRDRDRSVSRRVID